MSRLFRTFTSKLKKTALHDFHLNELKGKMVPFAGYSMPVEYKERTGGILKEHLHVRNSAGLFDVSHMGQVKVYGKDRIEFINYLTVADLNQVEHSNAVLSLLMNEKGGIKDDTVITRFEDHISMVVNGACKEKDMQHMHLYQQEFRRQGKEVEVTCWEDHGLLAIQGPKAAEILQKVLKQEDLSKLKFMQGKYTQVQGLNNAEVLVTRCGYTGEDGFEVGVDYDKAVALADMLLQAGGENIMPCGLGARDSLRLEAGLCLYGHELEEDISPVEATLLWTIPKSKRSGGFLGADRVVEEIKNGVNRKRCGFVIEGGPSAREDTELLHEGEVVGKVTSGTFSPILKKPIGMAYVKTGLNKAGTKLSAKQRGKEHSAPVTKMPFVPTRYFK